MRMRARAQKRLGAIDQECERNAPFRVKSRCGCSILIGCAASEESGAAANGSLQAEMRVREGRGGREGRCAERVCRVASRDSCEKCGGGAAEERILRGAAVVVGGALRERKLPHLGDGGFFLHSHSVSSCAHKFEKNA